MTDPLRYRIADNQAQLTLGGNILVVDPAGPLVEYTDYARLRMERIHDLNQIGGLQEDYARLLADHNKTEEHNMALCERLQDLNGELFNASCANANMHKENARLKAEVEVQNQRINRRDEDVGRLYCENSRLKAEVERLTDTLNKLVKTPPEATGGVRVKVDFWTQYGSRLPSSYETFWENAAKEGKPSV